jgi:hypothetical protein
VLIIEIALGYKSINDDTSSEDRDQ